VGGRESSFLDSQGVQSSSAFEFFPLIQMFHKLHLKKERRYKSSTSTCWRWVWYKSTGEHTTWHDEALLCPRLLV